VNNFCVTYIHDVTSSVFTENVFASFLFITLGALVIGLSVVKNIEISINFTGTRAHTHTHGPTLHTDVRCDCFIQFLECMSFNKPLSG
jgi:hypothetical protein